MTSQQQKNPFSRCFSVKGSTKVVCEHKNGSFVIGDGDESIPAKRKRLKLYL
jgi:hypothetical protein